MSRKSSVLSSTIFQPHRNLPGFYANQQDLVASDNTVLWVRGCKTFLARCFVIFEPHSNEGQNQNSYSISSCPRGEGATSKPVLNLIMATPARSELSLSSTSVDSTHSVAPNSFTSIVRQYALINRWKPGSRTEQLWDKAAKNFHKEWSTPDGYAALCDAKGPENISALLAVKMEECRKNRTTYKSKDGTETLIVDLLYKIAIYLKRYSGLVSNRRSK